MVRVFFYSLVLSFVIQVHGNENYPRTPDLQQTPGSLCHGKSSKRYPEKISYCGRSVSKSEKMEVIRVYEQKLGYQILRYGRQSFKIDHLIPLCAGGSNEINNLWPQHQSIYELTDPLEGLVCEKMAQGRLLQARAIEYIMKAKLRPETSETIIREVQGL